MALQREVGSPAGTLEGLPYQWAISLLAGMLGVLGILGPRAVFCCFLAVAGSAVGGLLLTCSVGCWASYVGALDIGGPSWLDALRCLLYGSGFVVGYLLWVILSFTGTIRWCIGFECAIAAVVDEVRMADNAVGGRYLVNVEKATDVDSDDEDESEEEGTQEYFVDNSQLQSEAAFLAYRLNKRMEDKDEEHLVAYGSTVHGIDEGDGWLRVGNRFLPMMVRGVHVLVLRPPKEPGARPSTGSETQAQQQGHEQSGAVRLEGSTLEFEEFVRVANDSCGEGAQLDQAELRAAWEASGRDLGRAVEALLQHQGRQAQHPR